MSTTPTCYNVGNGAVPYSECRWNQIDDANMLQNTIPPVWNVFPVHSVASVPVAYIPGCSKKPAGAVKKTKRYRTAFTTEQVLVLQAEYATKRYLNRLRRFELAKGLRLDERALKIWFQNRRMKEKKDREDSEETTSTSDGSEEGNSSIPIPIHEHTYKPVTSYPAVMPVSSAMPSYAPPAMPASWLPPAMPDTSYPHSLLMPRQNECQETFLSSETEFLELEPEVVPITDLGRPEPTPSASSEEKDWELSKILSDLYGD